MQCSLSFTFLLVLVLGAFVFEFTVRAAHAMRFLSQSVLRRCGLLRITKSTTLPSPRHGNPSTALQLRKEKRNYVTSVVLLYLLLNVDCRPLQAVCTTVKRPDYTLLGEDAYAQFKMEPALSHLDLRGCGPRSCC